jgi:hypothetical protein
MKKRMVIYIIIAIVIAFFGISMYKANELKNIQIVSTVTIQGDQQKVFDMVKYLRNFPKWSPFLAQDPTQKYSIKGTDGTIGAQYHWEGNNGKDLGYQEIVSIEEGRFIYMRCDIQKPFVAKPTFDYSFFQTPAGVEVRQEFKLESALPDAFFMWLFGAKSNMEKMNRQGLELLKKAVEGKS